MSTALPSPIQPDPSPIRPETSGLPGEAYVVRVATAYLVVDHDAEQDVGLADRLVNALEADPRVTRAVVPPLDVYWSPQYQGYSLIRPADEGEDAEFGVLEGTRHVHIQEFSSPIAFEFHVPKKNQPKVHEGDEIAAEDYVGLWNGTVLQVTWSQPVADEVGSSGGQVVEDILKDATARVGAGLMIQACNPMCTYVFVHTALRVVFDAGVGSDSYAYDPADPYVMQLKVAREAPNDDAPLLRVALDVWSRTKRPVEAFSTMKNLGRQILDLENLVRWDLDRLNQLHHQRSRAAQGGWHERLAAVWEYRSWRRKSRFYLSRLWLGLGSLERLKRSWTDRRLKFDQVAAEAGVEDLFRIDTYDEVTLVEDLDLSLVEAAIEHAGDRLSSTAIAAATVGGAVAGAVVAAIIAWL